MNSATANFQLKTILRNYETGGHLVYHKQDQNFYNAPSISKLNKNEYETNSQEVASRIQQFIKDNQTFLDRSILSQLSIHLESRIRKLKTGTGIMGIIGRLLSLFYYAFNNQSKVRQNQQQHSLEDVKNVLHDALSQKVDEENSVVIEVNNPNNIPSAPPKATPSPAVAELPTTLKSPLQVLTPQPASIQTTRAQTPQPTNLPASLRTPLRNTPAASTGNIPEAPLLTPPAAPPLAPPLTPSFASSLMQLIRRSPAKVSTPLAQPAPANLLLPNEPAPPSFNGSDYEHLSIETLEQQIKDIETYVQQAKAALAPLQEIVRDYEELQKSIKENDLRLSKFRRYKKQCEDVKRHLEEGKKQGIAVLSHKASPSSEIPFYPEGLPEQISANPAKFPANLKISQAILTYDGLIKHFEQFIDMIIPAQQTQFNQDCGILREQCQKEHGMDLKAIGPLVENKVEQLNKWQRYKTSRENEKTKKLTAIKLQAAKTTSSNNHPAQGMRFSLPSGLAARLSVPRVQKETDEFKEEVTARESAPAKHPILDMLERLPENIRFTLNRLSIAGTEAENIANNFETSFYGQLSIPPSRMKISANKKSDEGKEELEPRERS